MLLFFLLSIFVSHPIDILLPPALAVPSQGLERKAAKKLAETFTGNPEENVDGRLGKMLATQIACKVGVYFQEEGLIKVISSFPNQSFDQPTISLLDNQSDKIDRDLKRWCNENLWKKQFDDASFFNEIDGDSVRQNVAVTNEIMTRLKPELESEVNLSLLLKGDFIAYAIKLFGRGSLVQKRLKELGLLDFQSQNSLELSTQLSQMAIPELQRTISELRIKYDYFCEPFQYYESIRESKTFNAPQSVLTDWAASPIERAYTSIIEILLLGNGEKMEHLVRNDEISISRFDVNSHEFAQHKKHDESCYNSVIRLELALRQMRGRNYDGRGTGITPSEMRGLLRYLNSDLDVLLFSPEITVFQEN